MSQSVSEVKERLETLNEIAKEEYNKPPVASMLVTILSLVLVFGILGFIGFNLLVMFFG